MEHKLDSCCRRYPSLVRIQPLGWAFTLGYDTEVPFHLLHSEKLVRFPRGIDILIYHVEAS